MGVAVPMLSAVYVEDDELVASATVRSLELEGMSVRTARDGRDGIACVLAQVPDVVLLDVSLPGIDGIGVCREVRSFSDVPIVMVSGQAGEVDRLLAFDAGADDYLPKPFSCRELVARIRAHVRRARGLAGPAKIIRAGRLRIDPGSVRAFLDDCELSLTTYEFKLLRVLAERVGRVMSREQLVDLVRGSPEEAFDRSVDVHVCHLRQKLGDSPRSPRLLKTVRGVGYVLVADDAEERATA